MTPKQFARALLSLGLMQITLARALHVNERTVRDWKSGATPVPTAVAALLNLMIDTKSGIKDLRI
jgi:DNA-binding transcriptional regulator YiaG